MDRWAESLLLTLIEEAPELLSENPSYDSRANFMLNATMGLNGFISMGVDEDWATHMIGHELTALCGLDHGETLAIVHPGVMDIMRKEKHGKLVQYARRVWNITIENEEQAIDEAIERTENFFRSIGKKTRVSEYGIGNDVIDTIVQRFTDRGWAVGEHGIVTPEKTRLILEKVL
jgi:NADP-dependent alcohol dehydrogenase